MRQPVFLRMGPRAPYSLGLRLGLRALFSNLGGLFIRSALFLAKWILLDFQVCYFRWAPPIGVAGMAAAAAAAAIPRYAPSMRRPWK